MPAFAPDGGAVIVLLRMVSVAGLISSFGTLAFLVLVLPRAAANGVAARLVRLARLSAAAGILALAAWLLAEAGAMADATDTGQMLAALPSVLTQTRFGAVVAWQSGALLLALLLAAPNGVRLGLASLAALLALLLQAGHGHALAMRDGPSLLLAAGLLHLLGAGLWLGGLLPLALAVRGMPTAGAAGVCRWFSPVGWAGVALVAGSALVQGWALVGGFAAFVGTAYGWMALAKLGVFAVLLCFGWRNRYRLAPALARTGARRTLLRSLAGQTAAGLLLLCAAAALSSLPPGMHTQPVWPFTLRPSLDALREDPGVAREVLTALALLAAGWLLLGVAAWRRRALRWVALPAGLVALWLTLPHLDVLLVPATPTSFYRSPTGFAAASIVQGAALYPQHCATCHGVEGRGDGPGQTLPSADLTARHLWAHDDGELFGWLSQGMATPDGTTLAMPGFADVLTEEDRWALIDYLRAHNAGLAAHAAGGWATARQAPGFSATCAGGAEKSLAELQGGFVRLVIGDGAAVAGVTTILIDAPASARPAPGLCIAEDATVGPAYAILAGITPAALPGAQFLIDGAGWLRAMRPRDAVWKDLAAELRDLAAHPVAADGMAADIAM